MPKISVIVPVYKVEKYIHRCVDSILGQTFSDFELILVDDGSPDNCGAICDEYAAKDSRVVVIHQENGGLSAARNAGIDWAFANSDSQWLTFVDSDDWIHPEYLEKLLCAAMANDCELAICDHLPVFENGKTYMPSTGLRNRILTRTEALELLGTEEYWLYIHACHKLYSKCLFSDIRFPVGYIHEDGAIVHHIFFACKRIGCISDRLYYYWQRADSITGNEIDPQHIDGLFALADRLCFTHTNRMRWLKERTIIDYVEVFWTYYPLLNTGHMEYFSRIKKGLRKILPLLVLSPAVSVGRKIRMIVIAVSPSFYNRLDSFLTGCRVS